ncbi:UNVERIFIED_CONTAM: hypothetical protein HDU68_004721 [Siphonaria sp. JEL0065]|nr:hypothetical protein HDU68_004721 [Siphonaria sp. JEL0065]
MTRIPKTPRISTPKAAIKLQEAHISTPKLPEPRPSTTKTRPISKQQQRSQSHSQSRPQTVPSKSSNIRVLIPPPASAMERNDPTNTTDAIPITTPQLPATTTEATPAPPVPRKKEKPTKPSTAPAAAHSEPTATETEPKHPLLPDVILNYINRSRKSVRNRVTHGIPRKPVSPQKLALPHEKKPGNGKWKNSGTQLYEKQQFQNGKSGVLPSVCKKPLITKSGGSTRPSTQQRINELLTLKKDGSSGSGIGRGVSGSAGGGTAGVVDLGGIDSWETFQNCLETAKALGQSGNPMSLLDTAELVTQLWNHYRTVKKHS